MGRGNDFWRIRRKKKYQDFTEKGKGWRGAFGSHMGLQMANSRLVNCWLILPHLEHQPREGQCLKETEERLPPCWLLPPNWVFPPPLSERCQIPSDIFKGYTNPQAHWHRRPDFYKGGNTIPAFVHLDDKGECSFSFYRSGQTCFWRTWA